MAHVTTRSRLADIAEDQWGLITRRQASDAGIAPATLNRLAMDDAVLKRVAHGVYRLAGAPQPEHQDLRAAWLQLAPALRAWERDAREAVVSHRSAADMYGLGHLNADRLEFTVAQRRRSKRRDVRLHRRAIGQDEWIVLRGLPVTRPARIASDLLYDQEDPAAVAHVIGDALRGYTTIRARRAGAKSSWRTLRAAARRRAGAAQVAARSSRRRRQRALDVSRAGNNPARRCGPERVSTSCARRPISRYATPAAFRRALTDKLKALAEESRWQLRALQRQLRYDRLLERLYMVDDGWIEDVALLARELGVRASVDIDIYRRESVEAAEADLRKAAQRDIRGLVSLRGRPRREHRRGDHRRTPARRSIRRGDRLDGVPGRSRWLRGDHGRRAGAGAGARGRRSGWCRAAGLSCIPAG